MIQDGKAVLQIPLTKRTCRLLLGTPQNPRQYRRLGGQSWVSTQRQTAIKLLPPLITSSHWVSKR